MLNFIPVKVIPLFCIQSWAAIKEGTHILPLRLWYQNFMYKYFHKVFVGWTRDIVWVAKPNVCYSITCCKISHEGMQQDTESEEIMKNNETCATLSSTKLEPSYNLYIFPSFPCFRVSHALLLYLIARCKVCVFMYLIYKERFSQTLSQRGRRAKRLIIEDFVPLSVYEPHDHCATARSMR